MIVLFIIMHNNIIVKEVLIEEAVKVNETIVEFGEAYKKDYFEGRYKGKNKLIIVAYVDGQAAGYIIGYDKYQDKSFYCWMAGVNPNFRKKGLLKALMEYEDKWAIKNGYNKIKIKTRNNRRDMLAYLVKYGFYFTKVEEYEDIVENRIYLERELS